MDLRGDCQEAFYNVARAFHQLGLLSNAVNFYKRALNCPPLKTEDGKVKLCNPYFIILLNPLFIFSPLSILEERFLIIFH